MYLFSVWTPELKPYLLLLLQCSCGDGNRPKLSDGEENNKQEVIVSLQNIQQSEHLFFSSFFTVCDILLNTQEGEQGQVRLLVEAEDTLPVDVVLSLLVQSVEGEERRVETRQQDWKQQSRAARHTAEDTHTQEGFMIDTPPRGNNASSPHRPVFTQVSATLAGHQSSLAPSCLGGWWSARELNPPLLEGLGKETYRASLHESLHLLPCCTLI